jgi:hypothetical protein
MIPIFIGKSAGEKLETSKGERVTEVEELKG